MSWDNIEACMIALLWILICRILHFSFGIIMQFSNLVFRFMCMTWKIKCENFSFIMLHEVATTCHKDVLYYRFSRLVHVMRRLTRWLNDVRVSHDKTFRGKSSGKKSENIGQSSKERRKISPRGSTKSICRWIEFSVVFKFPAWTEDLWLKAMRIRKQSGIRCSQILYRQETRLCLLRNLSLESTHEQSELNLHNI